MASETKLKQWLTRTSTTQVQLAALIGVCQTQLTKYVSGKVNPSLTRALAIQRATDGAVPVECWEKKKSKKTAPRRRAA